MKEKFNDFYFLMNVVIKGGLASGRVSIHQNIAIFHHMGIKLGSIRLTYFWDKVEEVEEE